jgi:hypothetical protein
LLGYREQALFMEWPKDYAHRAGPQINVCASQSPDPWPPKPDDPKRAGNHREASHGVFGTFRRASRSSKRRVQDRFAR